MTYDNFMNKIFWMCVDALNAWADLMGWTYEELNIWIFIVIHPLLTLFLFFMVWYQRRSHYKKLAKLTERWTLLTEVYFDHKSKD
ncbi:MAG: hypothetical protein CMK23_05460 [Porticoccaceae bacterium]|nr:hypothetical protein [Porticoccaceae bacterium]|tara:strand:- start:38699 stop:38953 length:255 start_codon:yes stop_codon:yes gene_type:complete